MNVSGAFSAGSGWFVDEPSYFREFNDKVSWLHGKHNIQAGVMFNAQSNGDLAFPPMNWSFSGQFTGNALADYIIGPPQWLQRDDHHHRPWPLQAIPAIRAGHLQGSQECDTGSWSSLRLPDALDRK